MHGTHIKGLIAGARADALADPIAIGSALVELVGLLGMRILLGPSVVDVPLQIQKRGGEPFEDEGGVTGVVVLSTSHCAIHTWPQDGTAVLDVYSCREFDAERVRSWIDRNFAAPRVQIVDLSVALAWGIGGASGIVGAELETTEFRLRMAAAG